MEKLRGDNFTVTRSPIRSIGSKAKLIQKHKLWEFFPPCKSFSFNDDENVHHSARKVYVELFCGSALMFFNLRPVPIYAILNDSNHDIFNFFNVVKDKYDEFMKELEYTWCGNDYIDKYAKKDDDVSRAMCFYIENRRDNIIPTPVEFPKREQFDAWKKRLDACRMQMWNMDYKDALTRLNTVKYVHRTNSTEYIIFEDPPYVKTENFYKHFTVNDHEILAKLNHETTHRVLLTYNDCELVRKLYADWNCIELESYSNMNKKHYVELLFSNRPLQRYDEGMKGKLTRFV